MTLKIMISFLSMGHSHDSNDPIAPENTTSAGFCLLSSCRARGEAGGDEHPPSKPKHTHTHKHAHNPQTAFSALTGTTVQQREGE